jgi:hypothetical protein
MHRGYGSLQLGLALFLYTASFAVDSEVKSKCGGPGADFGGAVPAPSFPPSFGSPTDALLTSQRN